ncbi:MAG: AAA family ATPase, partial [Acidimicrobiia bacterium]
MSRSCSKPPSRRCEHPVSEPEACPAGVVSLRQLLVHPPPPKPALVEPSLLPQQGILFVGGEPKVGKSLLVTNLALALAAGSSTAGFSIPQACRVLICQFELP